MDDGAYAMLQATKPQSLAPALNDSPVGLASWIWVWLCSRKNLAVRRRASSPSGR